jgi:hypothetical protein
MGAYYQRNTFANPYLGVYGTSKSYYNPWTGASGYHFRIR